MRRAAFLGLVLAGYLAAVAAASAVTVAMILLPEALPGLGGPAPFRQTVVEIGPPMLAIGFLYTLLCAFPGFVAAIWLGERDRWMRGRTYAAAGFANVVPALLVFWMLSGSPFEMPVMVYASFPGGLAGGAAYWLTAGRIVARRRGAAR